MTELYFSMQKSIEFMNNLSQMLDKACCKNKREKKKGFQQIFHDIDAKVKNK